MQRTRILLIVFIVMWLAVPLLDSSLNTTSPTAEILEPIQIEDTLKLAPVDQTVLSDCNDYVYWYDDVNGIGDVIDFINMIDPDEDYGTLMERDLDPGILTQFKFERVFQFNSLAYQYLDWKLEVRGYDYTGIGGYWPETLKFYSSESAFGPWTEIGVLDAQTPTSYSWNIEITTGPYWNIKIESTDQFNDWVSRNEWRLEYLRIKCIDRKSWSEGVNIDIAHDGDNLYPYKGAGTNDYYRFYCSASNEEGSELIDYIRLFAKSEDGQYLWGVTWDDGSWNLAPWSNGVNLLVSECCTTSTSQIKTAVFAVQFTYGCDTVSNIDLELYHESNTWNAIRTFDKTEGNRDLDQEPALHFSLAPSMPARSDPLSSPLLTGTVTFSASSSGVTPHPAHAFAHSVRTDPAPSGEWSGGASLDSSGNFVIRCPTKGVAGTENTFRVRIYESAALNEYVGLESYVETVSEEVVAYEYGANESSIPIDTSTFIFTKLKYFSDDLAITNATVTWNGVSLTYNPSAQRWEATLSPHSEPTTIQFDSLAMNTAEEITAVKGTPTFSVHWIRLGTFLHLSVVQAYVPVSTVYDPHAFIINAWLTDQNADLFAGWINLTIGGEEFDIYCDGMNYTVFQYYPSTAGIYTLFTSYAGDQYHTSSNQTFTGLTATLRDLDFRCVIPSDMLTLVSTPYTFFDVYDNDYSGIFKGVTYIRDLPINISVSIWWTLSPDFGEPRNFVDTWNIIIGEGTVSWALPWDLDGDGILTDDDFECYIIILLDGLDVFEDTTIYQSVRVQQDLAIDVSVPEITYSDLASFELEIESLHDSSYSDDLGTTIEMYISSDNETWLLIDDVYTYSSGRGTISWICDQCGPLFFKFEVLSNRFAPSAVYPYCIAEREGTRLTVIQVNSFTYSDQGVMLILLQTNDNNPLPDYPVYLEILDGTWVGIGIGLTNETGYVNILWTPTLPYGTYSVRVRAPMTESVFYNSPENEVSILQVNKESLMITLDEQSGINGYVGALVTDDEGNPIEGVPVSFYVAGNSQPLGTVTTDPEGVSKLETILYGAQVLRAVVQENDYFQGSFGEMNLALPQDVLTLTMLVGSVFAGAFIVNIARKKRRGSVEPAPKPLPAEARDALDEERKLIPERRREETERKIAELDGGVEDASEP
jgi:hypothetical protein